MEQHKKKQHKSKNNHIAGKLIAVLQLLVSVIFAAVLWNSGNYIRPAISETKSSTWNRNIDQYSFDYDSGNWHGLSYEDNIHDENGWWSYL